MWQSGDNAALSSGSICPAWPAYELWSPVDEIHKLYWHEQKQKKALKTLKIVVFVPKQGHLHCRCVCKRTWIIKSQLSPVTPVTVLHKSHVHLIIHLQVRPCKPDYPKHCISYRWLMQKPPCCANKMHEDSSGQSTICCRRRHQQVKQAEQRVSPSSNLRADQFKERSNYKEASGQEGSASVDRSNSWSTQFALGAGDEGAVCFCSFLSFPLHTWISEWGRNVVHLLRHNLVESGPRCRFWRARQQWRTRVWTVTFGFKLIFDSLHYSTLLEMLNCQWGFYWSTGFLTCTLSGKIDVSIIYPKFWAYYSNYLASSLTWFS